MGITLTEMKKIWENALKQIKVSINEDGAFDYFFSNSYIYDIKGSTAIIVAPHLVAKSMFDNKYHDQIVSILNDLCDEELDIQVVMESDIRKNHGVEVKEESAPKLQSVEYFDNSKVKKELTFDNFVVGDFNKDAHKAAMYVARNGGTLFNPLFIYSHSGLGKTHLLHAIGNEVKATRLPNAKIVYISADEFVEAYIKFVRGEKESQSLKDYFKDVDILLFDDVQFLNGKVKTEEMFFYIYQDLINRGKRIIITSDRQPNELNGIEDRLVTRFTQGLTVKISEPDVETCVEILKKKISSHGLNVEKFESNVLYFLAEKFSRDVRELEGALNALMFDCMSLDENAKVTMDVAIKAVSSIKGGKNIATQLSEQKIISIVADYYNLTPSQITGKDRNAQIVLARHISMYLIRNNLDIPLKRIGEMFGGKDHTTVMSALTKVDKELKTDQQLQDAIKALEKKIKQ